MSLHVVDKPGDARVVDAISAFLAAEKIDVRGFEHLADEGAVMTRAADASETVVRGGSSLRALWIVDMPSRPAAIELAKRAPGEDGTLEIRESFTAEDVGAPPEEAPPPPPIRTSGTHRFIAFIRTPHEDVMPTPTLESSAPMAAYCAPLIANNTMIGGEGLRKSEKGARVRRSAAQRFVLDGPFTESKELVGGYMIVQTATLDDAIEVVRPWLRIHGEIVGVAHTEIEVRRLLD